MSLSTGTYFDQSDGTHYVQSHRASSNEFYVCSWLEEFGHAEDYIFQYDLTRVGRRVRGAVYIDIVLWNTSHFPVAGPIEIDVEQWHKDKFDGEDTLRRSLIQKKFGQPALSLTDAETNTPEAAKRTVRSKLL